MNEIKTFEERKQELLKKGKENGFLTFEELAEQLKGLELDAESLDNLYNFLNDNNIEVVADSEIGDSEEDDGADVSVDGNNVSTGKELNEYMEANPLDGSEIEIIVLRDKKEQTFKVTPKKAGFTLGMNVGTYVKASPIEVIRYSFTELRYDTWATWSGLKMLFTGNATKDDVSGPVGIVKIVGDSYEASKEEGFREVFLQIAYLIIILSVNLGIVNLLPFPALDGGRLVFIAYEAITKKKPNQKVETALITVTMLLLFGLMIYVTFGDILRLLRVSKEFGKNLKFPELA